MIGIPEGWRIDLAADGYEVIDQRNRLRGLADTEAQAIDCAQYCHAQDIAQRY